jgi:hypothetical protein
VSNYLSIYWTLIDYLVDYKSTPLTRSCPSCFGVLPISSKGRTLTIITPRQTTRGRWDHRSTHSDECRCLTPFPSSPQSASPFVPPPPHPPPHLHSQPLRPPTLHPHLHQHSTPASPFLPHILFVVNPGSKQPLGPGSSRSRPPTALGESVVSRPWSLPPLVVVVYPMYRPPTIRFFPSLQSWHCSGPSVHRYTSRQSSLLIPTSTDPQSWRQDMASPPMPLTPQLAVDLTRHFLSTHRRSPTSLSSHGSNHSDRERLGSSAGGSESRPQSRRLSIVGLCNDADADPTFDHLPLSATFQGSQAQVHLTPKRLNEPRCTCNR